MSPADEAHAIGEEGADESEKECDDDFEKAFGSGEEDEPQ